MTDSEVRQKFEAYWKSVNQRPKIPMYEVFDAGMRAGEIAMKEKAAKMAEAKFESACSGVAMVGPCYGHYPVTEPITITVGGTPFSDAIRALPLSGAEEAKKEVHAENRTEGQKSI